MKELYNGESLGFLLALDQHLDSISFKKNSLLGKENFTSIPSTFINTKDNLRDKKVELYI